MKLTAKTQPNLSSEAETVLQPKPSKVEADPTNPRPQDNAQQENAKEPDGPAQKTSTIWAKQLGTGATEARAARIFDEANTQLGGPDSNARRSALQHLRAAASAIKAELRAGGAMHSAIDDQPYRKDLQNTVRPRRPDRCCNKASCNCPLL